MSKNRNPEMMPVCFSFSLARHLSIGECARDLRSRSTLAPINLTVNPLNFMELNEVIFSMLKV